MFKSLLNSLRRGDWYLLINIVLLMIFGLAALYSLQIKALSPDFTLFYRQLTLAIFGLAIFFVFSLVDYHLWGDYYKIILIVSVLLLVGVLFKGVSLGGSTGWYVVGGQSFQPVELAKIALIIFLARYFSQHARDFMLTKHLFISGLVSALLIALLIIQPDLGSAMILFFIWLALALFLPLPRSYLLKIFLALIIMAAASWFLVLRDYQKERILTFVNPSTDPLGAGYNVRQSMVAVGAGRLIGRGLTSGSQSQLNFLPTQETDFIFAVIAEELGLVGAGILLLLFLSLFYRLFRIIKETRDGFGSFLVLGILAMFTGQLAVNVGMNLGLAPVAGLTLPFVSYGGSSLITSLLAMAIVQNIQRRNKQEIFNA